MLLYICAMWKPYIVFAFSETYSSTVGPITSRSSRVHVWKSMLLLNRTYHQTRVPVWLGWKGAFANKLLNRALYSSMILPAWRLLPGTPGIENRFQTTTTRFSFIESCWKTVKRTTTVKVNNLVRSILYIITRQRSTRVLQVRLKHEWIASMSILNDVQEGYIHTVGYRKTVWKWHFFKWLQVMTEKWKQLQKRCLADIWPLFGTIML